MKLQTVIVGSFAVLALAACGKGSDAQKAVDHINGELDKAQQESELRSHKYVSACDSTNVLWKAAGVNSQNVVFDIQNGSAGRTIQFFGAPDCNDATVVAQATYAGTQNLGTAASDNSNILDLNYQTVAITISNQDLVNSLNGGLAQIQNCGISNWAVGAGRDVTAASGGANCLIAPKPSQTFDIVKTDGQTTFFGLKDAAHDAKSEQTRPVQIDREHPYTKK